MSLRFGAGPADAEARAVFPAFGCPSGGLWYNSELEQPADTPHLLRCLRCAALNGRSAFRCWSCEAELVASPPLGKPLAGAGSDTGPDPSPQRNHHPAFFDALLASADPPTAPDTAREPAPADAPSFSAPISALALDERLAAFSQHRRRVPRRLVGIAAIVVLAAASATGAYLIQRPQPFIALDANPASRHTGIVEPLADAEPVTAHMTSEAVRTEAAAPASIEPLQPAAAQTAAPPRAAPPPPVVAALTATRGGTARGARHARNNVATPPAPIRDGSDTVRPPFPTPARPGACTATVAALGLCQAANAQP